MRRLDQSGARDFLVRNGLTSAARIKDVLGGFDWDQAVYEQFLWPDDVLYQYIRNPSQENRSPDAGNWFTLAGATMAGLAISSGLAGRRLQAFRVVMQFTALEGTAAPKHRRLEKEARAKGKRHQIRPSPEDFADPNEYVHWGWAGGGPGGSTQIYVPSTRLGCLTTSVARER